MEENEALRKGFNLFEGQAVHQAVAESLGLKNPSWYAKPRQKRWVFNPQFQKGMNDFFIFQGEEIGLSNGVNDFRCRNDETLQQEKIDHRDRWPFRCWEEHGCEIFSQAIGLRLYRHGSHVSISCTEG